MTLLAEFAASFLGVIIGTWGYHAWKAARSDGDPRTEEQ